MCTACGPNNLMGLVLTNQISTFIQNHILWERMLLIHLEFINFLYKYIFDRISLQTLRFITLIDVSWIKTERLRKSIFHERNGEEYQKDFRKSLQNTRKQFFEVSKLWFVIALFSCLFQMFYLDLPFYWSFRGGVRVQNWNSLSDFHHTDNITKCVFTTQEFADLSI